MSIAMFRAAGPNFDVDGFLRLSSTIQPDNVWRRGDAALHGRIRSESGFAAPIAECESAEEVVQRVSRFLSSCSQLITGLAASGAAAVIDISLEVGADEHYTTNVRFDPDLLRQFAQLGVELEITGYPVSDDSRRHLQEGGLNLDHSVRLQPGRLRFHAPPPAEALLSLTALLYQRGYITEWPREVRGAADVVCTFASTHSLDAAAGDLEDFVRKHGAGGWTFDPELDPLLEIDEIVACTASRRSAVFLAGPTLDCVPPVKCADCGGAVPDHLLPADVDLESWARAYRALYTLSFDDGYERWAKSELGQIHGSIHQTALRLTRRLRDLTGSPAFYLFHHTPLEPEVCPSCSGPGAKSTFTGVRFTCPVCLLAW
jgi:hypothetical protein